jgi:hypothetical protein
MDEFTGWHLITPFLIFEGLLQLACVLLLLWGIEIGRYTVNFITVVKVLLVIFLIIGGLIFYNPVNLSDGFAPYGVSGIMTGATSCFFGYVGYDEVRRLPFPTIQANFFDDRAQNFAIPFTLRSAAWAAKPKTRRKTCLVQLLECWQLSLYCTC